jgi:hypothetical protein
LKKALEHVPRPVQLVTHCSAFIEKKEKVKVRKSALKETNLWTYERAGR